MINTTNSVISSQKLQMTLQKLADSQVPANIAYRFKKLLDAINVKLKLVSEDYKEVIGKQFGELDEDGNIIPEANPNGFKLKDGHSDDDMLKALEEFGKRPVEIDRWQITLADLRDVKISAAEMAALDVLLADPEEEGLAPVTHLKR